MQGKGCCNYIKQLPPYPARGQGADAHVYTAPSGGGGGTKCCKQFFLYLYMNNFFLI